MPCVFGLYNTHSDWLIALFMVSFPYLHLNVIQHRCETIFGLKLQNSPKLPHVHVQLLHARLITL